jgi:hypothetical protein
LASDITAICETLRTKYQVNDAHIYPNMSIDVDILFGLEGEVKRISELLNTMGFEANAENIFHVMQMKSKLLIGYQSANQGKVVLLQFGKIVSEDVKPVGITIPTDLLFVTGLTAVLLYLAGRFVGSFLDEAGKIFARELLIKNRKKIPKKLNLTELEYYFLEKQTVQLLKDETKMELLIEDLREIISTKKKKEHISK